METSMFVIIVILMALIYNCSSSCENFRHAVRARALPVSAPTPQIYPPQSNQWYFRMVPN